MNHRLADRVCKVDFAVALSAGGLTGCSRQGDPSESAPAATESSLLPPPAAGAATDGGHAPVAAADSDALLKSNVAKSHSPYYLMSELASNAKKRGDKAPADEAEIEKTTSTLLAEASTQPDAFYERSARSLQRVGTKLQAWNKGGAHRASMQRMQSKLDVLCAPLPKGDAERATCERILNPPATPAA